ncbi:biotin--[acetyl-CoA-carboxylase] ligase [Thioalkalivibrio sp. HK1]|uniref:biotin--[acetyl-CoA-carboxylase] ligase n=1 Tax=Thioalkalivibrio sp. HK1 TaxID=1469245 RepID=UPI000472EB87|nr:biotin/lipoate--protein ligase family protein [Thioalkalivibrio sp. HK1]
MISKAEDSSALEGDDRSGGLAFTSADLPHLPPAFHPIQVGAVGSVVDEALARSLDGAEEGTLIIAAEQSDARTRRGHRWQGDAGNLHLALIIRPDYPNEEGWQLVYVNALAASSAIAQLISPMTGLRFSWPNRLLINDLLAARIDMRSNDPEIDPHPDLILGLSVNIASHPPQPEPEEYNSIHACGSVDIGPFDALEAYASCFLSWSALWADEGFAPIRRAFLIRMQGLHERCDLRLFGGEIVSDRIEDIDDKGRLIMSASSIGPGEYFGMAGSHHDRSKTSTRI